jgi:hypothetical protein
MRKGKTLYKKEKKASTYKKTSKKIKTKNTKIHEKKQIKTKKNSNTGGGR